MGKKYKRALASGLSLLFSAFFFIDITLGSTSFPFQDTLNDTAVKAGFTTNPDLPATRAGSGNPSRATPGQDQTFYGNFIIGNAASVINKHNLIVKGDWVNDGTYIDEHGTVVFSGSNPSPAGLLHYDDGVNYTSIGTGGAVTFDVAIRFDASQLIPYEGKKLKVIRIIPGEVNCSYQVRVWTGAGAASLVVDQAVASPVIDAWNDITLTDPVAIDTSQELWFGYQCNSNTGYPAGCDAGPAVVGYGDMIFYGGIWRSIFTDYGLNFNWNIQGILEDIYLEQEVAGSQFTAFNNLTIVDISSTSILTSGQTIKGILKVDGIMEANGNMTLLSSASQTALIDGAGTGEILGDVTMQRYLDPGIGYRYISSPFQSATVNELSDETDLGSAFPSFYRYDENRTSSGWVEYTEPGDTLWPMHGYAANFGPSLTAITADMTGQVSNGSLMTSIYNHNQPYTLGFNLVGNPYPSPIDWDAASGWSRNNIDDAVYYFNPGTTDPYSGTYSSYVNGVSSDGIANGLIPSMQGFFVHVSDGIYPVTASLGVNNQVRVNTLSPVFHKSGEIAPYPMIRVTAGFSEESGKADALVIYFNEKAGPGFDRHLEALKIMNTDVSVPSLYAVTRDARQLSICALPRPEDSLLKVPLELKIEKDGIISFLMTECTGMPPGTFIYLFDSLYQKYQDLQASSGYRVHSGHGTTGKRFYIVFSKKEFDGVSISGPSFFAYHSGGELYIVSGLGQNEKGRLVISNMTGQVIWEKDITGDFRGKVCPGLNSGVYIVSLLTDRQIISNKVLIFK